MARVNKEGPTAVEEPVTQALAIPQSGNAAMAVADGDRSDTRGKENLRSDEMVLGRIALAQKTSPQLEPQKPEFIDGLRLFEMFNTLTGERYGNGPIRFTVLGIQRRAAIFDAEGKLIERNVNYDDERCEFGENGAKPIATRFIEFLILPEADPVPTILSFKKTELKTANKLQGFLAMRPGVAWGGLYTLESRSKPAGGFTVAGFVVKPAGKTPDELKALAEAAYTMLSKSKVVLANDADRDEADPDDKTPF